MDFSLDPTMLREALLNLLIMIVSLSLHEWGHAYAADRLGDDTPRSQGRVTLNPIVHIDPIGTIIVPLMASFGLFGGLGVIGWAKPVWTTPSNFKHRTRDQALVTIAGPAMNVAIACFAVVGAVLADRFYPSTGPLFRALLSINILLVVFNLLPIPPLDGSKFLMYWFGMREETYANFARWGWIVLLLLINMQPFQMLFGFLYRLVAIPFALFYSALT